MSKLREAAQQALEALKKVQRDGDAHWPMTIDEAITALRAALAQEEQPFLITQCVCLGVPPAPHQAWNAFFDHAIQTRTFTDVCISALPRREWQGLTDEEICALPEVGRVMWGMGTAPAVLRAIHAALAALKEKNQ